MYTIKMIILSRFCRIPPIFHRNDKPPDYFQPLKWRMYPPGPDIEGMRWEPWTSEKPIRVKSNPRGCCVADYSMELTV